jgi:nucleotide-binding universal stress UspA family protein
MPSGEFQCSCVIFDACTKVSWRKGERVMYDKVLVALDGSKESECILEYVRLMAKGCGISKVVLVRVVEDFPPAAMNYLGEDKARAVQKKAHAVAEEYLSYAADALRTHCGGVDIAVLEGNPAHEILEYAEKNGVDMIAMSRRGAGASNRFTTGSVPRRIADDWRGALLTVPPEGCRP